MTKQIDKNKVMSHIEAVIVFHDKVEGEFLHEYITVANTLADAMKELRDDVLAVANDPKSSGAFSDPMDFIFVERGGLVITDAYLRYDESDESSETEMADLTDYHKVKFPITVRKVG